MIWYVQLSSLKGLSEPDQNFALIQKSPRDQNVFCHYINHICKINSLMSSAFAEEYSHLLG